jgi:hypothetical protein
MNGDKKMKSIQEILNEQKHQSQIGKISEGKLARTLANKLKAQDPEFRKNISKSKLGKKRLDMVGDNNIGKSQQERERRRKLWLGIPKPREQVEKIKSACKNLPLLKCPHCNMESQNKGNMNRYHFDNCKHKK